MLQFIDPVWTSRAEKFFADKQFAIARQIVGKFEKFSATLAFLRTVRKAKNDGEWVINPQGGPETFEFFDLLQRNNAVKVKLAQVRKDDEWKRFRREWGKTSSPEQQLFIIYQVLDG
ncbi:MAG: hypothetical protein AB8B47_12565 [Roseobacter sp.]